MQCVDSLLPGRSTPSSKLPEASTNQTTRVARLSKRGSVAQAPKPHCKMHLQLPAQSQLLTISSYRSSKRIPTMMFSFYAVANIAIVVSLSTNQILPATAQVNPAPIILQFISLFGPGPECDCGPKGGEDRRRALAQAPDDPCAVSVWKWMRACHSCSTRSLLNGTIFKLGESVPSRFYIKVVDC